MRDSGRIVRIVSPSLLLTVGIILLLPAQLVWAQSITGTISGYVKDPDLLPIPGAPVKLTHASTGATRESLTNEQGRFYFGSLQPGKYDLLVEMPGFRRLERKSINLTAVETLSAGDLILDIGEITDTVQVAAEGARVETETAERSGVLTSTQVEHLNIRGRSVMALLQLLPGVVDLDEPERLVHNWNISVQGNRRNTNNISLDGATLNAIGNQFNAVALPSMDAVEEVKVLLSNYSAEYGRLSGANVQLVTKSGTRDFHGLLSYFKRHEQFNANNFMSNRLGVPKGRYRFNTWTYNVGGPVYIPGKFNSERNKLFFFWSQEFWPVTTTLGVQRRMVPTALERQGDFSKSIDVNDRLISVRDYLTGKAFPNNLIPSNRIDRNGQALLKVFPLPNFLDRSISQGSYNYVFQDELKTPNRIEMFKLDFHASPSHVFTFNFTHHIKKEEAKSQFRGPSNFDWFRQVSNNDGYVYIGRYQHIFSPTLVNETTVSYSTRPWVHDVAADDLRAVRRDVVGFNLPQFHPGNNPLNVLPEARFGGIPNAARLALGGRFPLDTTHEIFTLASNLSKVWGNHSLKVGFYLDRIWADNQFEGPNFGEFDFGRNVNNPLDTGYAYANAVLGVFNSYRETTARPFPRAIVSNVEWFVQDRWKPTSRLSLDLGMRFYWLPHSFVANGGTAGFQESKFDFARQVQLLTPGQAGNRRVARHPATGQIFPANLIGAIAPGTGEPANGMVSSLDPGIPSALMKDRGIHFAPRLGFAYDLSGRGKTVLRGGLGMFYQRLAQGQVLYPYTTQPPLVFTPQIFFGAFSTLLDSSGFLFPTEVLGLDAKGKIPTVMNFSFGVQQDLGFGTVVEVSYVGSLGRHLLWARNLNEIPFGANFDPANIDPTTRRPLPPAFLRRFKGYNNVIIREPGSSSNYHSLQLTANRRFARALEFGTSWTWSKSMDFNSDDTEAVSTLVPTRVWNYGLSSFDRTHILKINWIWDVPSRSWDNTFLRAAFNNWQLSGIASFLSGEPLGVDLSTTTPTDITGSPTHGARTVITANPALPKDKRKFDQFFRTDVFHLPKVGTFGNAARTVLRGPGVNNWDIALYKNFPIRERTRLQFRCELYNAFNHTQFRDVDTTARFDPKTGQQVSRSFGQIVSARNARIMQFALRLHF